MRNAMHLVMRQDLNLEMVTLRSLRRAASRPSPFKEGLIRRRDVESHLEAVNGDLVERRLDLDMLRDRFLVAQGLYLFVAPIFSVAIAEPLRTRFVEILARGPYHLDAPLELFFQRAGEECYIEVAQAKLTGKEDAGLKAKRRTAREIDAVGHRAAERLGIGYDRADHFLLAGALDVASPLFHAGLEKDAALVTLRDDLEARYGCFCVRIPEYLRVPEAIR